MKKSICICLSTIGLMLCGIGTADENHGPKTIALRAEPSIVIGINQTVTLTAALGDMASGKTVDFSVTPNSVQIQNPQKVTQAGGRASTTVIMTAPGIFTFTAQSQGYGSATAIVRVIVGGEGDRILVYDSNVRKAANGLLEVVPPFLGERIDGMLFPPPVEPDPNSPVWTVTSNNTSTTLRGPAVFWTANGPNVETTVNWLFDYIPRQYDFSCEVAPGQTESVTIKAYPFVKKTLSWNWGNYFRNAGDVWNALPISGVQPVWPNEGASVSLENGWQERSGDNTAFLAFSLNANLDPLIGIEGRFNLLGGFTLPNWIRDHFDLGVYVVASGRVGVKGTIERDEDGLAGSVNGNGTIRVALEGIANITLAQLRAEGSWDALVLEVSVRGHDGWIQWKGALNSGPVKITVSFTTWGGWIQAEREWEIWDGGHLVDLSLGGDWANLWQYAR